MSRQKHFTIISNGWGVQTFTLSAMAAIGVIEKPNAIVHADTTHESVLTYDFAKRWTPWLENHGLKIVTVCDEKATGKLMDESIQTFIPAFTGSGGQARRQCTGRWKIAPVRRWLQENRNGLQVRQVMGISLDEFQRMRDSDVKYITNVYPLIDMRMTRADCVKWLTENNLEVPPKSACSFCPYHNHSMWRDVKAIPQDWEKAVTVDEHIRNLRKPESLYLHPSRKPLAEIDFRTPQEKGQLELWDSECQGVCWV